MKHLARVALIWSLAEAAPFDASSALLPTGEATIIAGEIRTDRFRILYTKNSALAAQELKIRIELERDRLGRVLGRDWPGVTEVRIGRGRDEFEQLALPEGVPPPWAAALAYPERNVILLESIGLSEPTGSITLRHELSHVALGQLGRGWPHWFQEGMAMYLTNETPLVARYAILYRAIAQDRLFHFEHLAANWPSHPFDIEIAYAQSLAFVSFLIDHYESERFGDMFEYVAKGDVFELAFAKAFHSSINVEEQRWREFASRRYSWVPLVTGGSALWGLAAVVCIAAYVRRKRQKTSRLAEMEREETLEPGQAANDEVVNAQQIAERPPSEPLH